MRFKDIADEQGYSLMEVLVALVLLLIVLIPFGQWLGKHLVDRTHLNKLVALQLAETTIEELLIREEFSSEIKEVKVNSQIFQISTQIQETTSELIVISVEIRKGEKLITQLKRSHYHSQSSQNRLSTQ